MQAPKCKQCGVNHWTSQPHKWPDVVVNKPMVVNKKPCVVVNKARSADRHIDKAARREYMKDYMAKRRALVH
jgi:hypothetical protein